LNILPDKVPHNGRAAVLVFVARPAQPSAQLNLLKFKLRTKAEKKSDCRYCGDSEKKDEYLFVCQHRTAALSLFANYILRTAWELILARIATDESWTDFEAMGIVIG
jgi:hypothetical protein